MSTLISFELFIRPALLGLAGHEAPREAAHHRLAHGFDEAPPAGKLQVRRARLTEAGLEFVGDSRSHLLHSYAEATHLVFVSPEEPGADDPYSAVGDRLMTWKIA